MEPSSSVHCLGSVPYLNAKPLILGLDDVFFAPPSSLADRLREGKVQAALVPVFECLECPRDYVLVNDVAIGSQGCVYSVILVSKVPFEKIKTVSLDADSKSSSFLLRVILKKFFDLDVEYFPEGTKTDAALWIGDRALAFHHKNPNAPYVMDLGEQWKKETGLPFVFALWAMRLKHASPELAQSLRQTKKRGLSSLSKIASSPQELEYLSKRVCYDCGAEQKKGIARFRELLMDLTLLKKSEEKLVWM